MNESEVKLEWYREVLALEPGSKVFFPYAKLLVEHKKPDEARFVLEKGLETHPEFIEARLFLIDLLHTHNHIDACGAQVVRLASIFATYPGFWEAWGQYAQSKGYSQDFSFALGLLGQMFRNQSLSFMDVLSAGLAQLSGQPQATQPQAQAWAQPVQTQAPARAAHTESAKPEQPVTLAPAEPVFIPVYAQGAGAMPRTDSSPISHPAQVKPTEAKETAAPNASKCSLRTRSMAELLAEQGDVEGAIRIFEELLAHASAAEKPALESRLAGLRSHEDEFAYVPADIPGTLSPAHAADLPRANTDTLDLLALDDLELEPKTIPTHTTKAEKTASSSKGGNARVMNLLENLAVRLETRVRQ